MLIHSRRFTCFFYVNMLLASATYAQAAPDSVARPPTLMERLGQLFGKKSAPTAAPTPAPACDKPVYLTFDTGHMESAPAIADVLNKHQVKVTFFVSNEKTKDGKDAMSWDWGQKFWKLRGPEGHEFASRTWDDVGFRGDVKGIEPRFVVQPGSGAYAGRNFTWEAKKYCDQIKQASDRIEDFTGKKALPLWRAPSGKTSAKLLATAKACGFDHVTWSLAGTLDNTPLATSLKNIAQADILLAHLGSASQEPAWETAVLEPLIVGLKERGLCFATLRAHPAFKPWFAAQAQPTNQPQPAKQP